MWRMWNNSKPTARILTLVFCISVVLGGSLPDLGNLAVYYWFPEGENTHVLNIYFLLAGLLGIIICGITLFWRRNMYNPLVLYLKRHRWMILCGVYLTMHITTMINYAPVPDSPEMFGWFNVIQRLGPTLLLGLLIPSIQRLLNRIANLKVWTIVGLVAVTACIAMYFFNTSERWFAWSTLGLLTLLTITIANNQSRLGNINAWLLGGMVALFAIGCFEILYQTGLLFYYDFFGCGIMSYYVSVALQLTWIVPALIVILTMRRRGMHLRISRTTLVCLGIALIATVVWFISGMDIPLLFWQGRFIEVNETARPLMIIISRCSQGFWLLAVTSAFLPSHHHCCYQKVEAVQ